MSARRRDEWLVEVPCMECGARDFEVTRPGWAEGLGDWLRFGGRWRPPRRICRRCGNASDARSYGVFGATRRGWWSVPIQLVQALRQRRTMIPVPATYLAATLVGAVVGMAAQLVLGWPWWLVAAGVVAAEGTLTLPISLLQNQSTFSIGRLYHFEKRHASLKRLLKTDSIALPKCANDVLSPWTSLHGFSALVASNKAPWDVSTPGCKNTLQGAPAIAAVIQVGVSPRLNQPLGQDHCYVAVTVWQPQFLAEFCVRGIYAQRTLRRRRRFLSNTL
jgi:hypothetical protein